jgi:hypothetical protein
MASQQIPSPPSTPNGDAWVEMSRDAEGIQYCSEDGSATIRLELISEGRSHRWEWTSHEVIVGINMWELRESWEQGQDDELLVPPPESVPVSRPVPEEHLGRAPHPEAETPVRAPLRVVPEPQPTPEPEPIPVEVPVPSEVERNARALAAAVRGRVRTYRELFHGRVPASYEPDVEGPPVYWRLVSWFPTLTGVAGLAFWVSA